MTRGGDSSSEPALKDLKEVYGGNVAGTLDIKQNEINSSQTAEKIKTFIETIQIF
ncbi:MAG: hypothetical protein GX640_12600 [Fibrobacter sp.]|mgnify:CR=1 FL=1|nr:hypothetical protein [Fibrobacter sp.]